ncbi:MAG: aspartate-semialdehyde dehydrogenase, partial [Bacteroidota bacterium]
DIMFKGKVHKVITPSEAVAMKPAIALFSAGGSASREWAPRFAETGTFVIDNSSAWRMFDYVPLVVPEINPDAISKDTKIIANPNCSTIQLVVALAKLHTAFKIKRLVISTYQSITGTGVKAVQQMENERNGIDGPMAYPHRIDKNCFPHGGDFLKNGYTGEEMKLLDETRKILRDNSIAVTSTVVRIPVTGGHSEAVNCEFHHDFKMEEIIHILKNTAGVVLQDDPSKALYPMPLYSEGKDDVFVGRIRLDESQPRTINLWIVSDNLRKGAATNAVQIAEYLLREKLIS